MIRIAIDTGPLVSGHSVRGIGVHTKVLIEELQKLNDSEIKIEGVDFSKTDLSKYDIAHYTSFNPYFISIPFEKPTKKVILTIHDLIYLIYPEHYPAGIRGSVKFWAQKYFIKNVDAIITISETSKKNICRLLPVQPDKVYVTHLAPKDIFRMFRDKKSLNQIRLKYDLPQEFVLYVGDVNYNKNLPMLIEACRLAKVQLVIVGKRAKDLIEGADNDLKTIRGPMDWIRFVTDTPHPELKHYKGLTRAIKNQKVITLGFVPDTDIVQIFNLATLYCQPSLYEGFGLGVLEAMASGTPVVSSKTQSLVEIAEDAALFANPKDPSDFAEKMLEIKNNVGLRNQLIKIGLETAKKFSWKKTAHETLQIYKKLI